jgi:Secretion system C-terminal sorting domain/Bacterial Ig domain
MKTLTTLIICLGLTLNSYSQNNAPIAVNDTVYITFNDSITFTEPGGKIMINDTDPDGNTLKIDTAIYSGTAFFQFDSIVSNFTRFSYKAQANYWGVDSLIYILKDNGAPVMYDTAKVYFFVKKLEFEHFNLNNINARVDHRGLFQDVTNGISAFEVPKGDTTNTIFAANLWVAGKNQDSVYSNSETFNAQLTYGRSGPIMDSIYYKKYYDYDWDRVWKVYANDINYHINNWNTTGYQPPQVFLDWPAHGDVSKGQAYNLAPYVDNNGDNFYNPYDGDYPKIKGQQAVYFIYNDMREKYSNRPMRSEVHGMVYGYHCPSDSAIYNTLFLDYTIYNRSNLTYDSTYIGMWTDFDIGGFSDDYVGCDVARSTFFGRNGDDFDEPSNGSQGYGAYPPAQGVTFLQGAKQDNDGTDNPFTQNIQDVITFNGTPYAGLGTGFGDGNLDNEFWGMEGFISYSIGGGQFVGDGDPSNILDYYNYLHGIWRDGSQMVYGGNGNAPSTGGTIPTKYLYPGITDPLWYGTAGIVATPSNWSSGGSSDIRGIGTTGPFTFEPDSSITITLAYVFGRDYQTTGNQAGIVIMQERVDSIRSYFNTDFVSVCGGALSVNDINEQENSLLVYPNPFNDELTVNYELENNTAKLVIYNLVGEEIMNQNILENTTKIDLTNQPNGIYFVTIVDGNNRISQKIIKQ